MIEVAPPAPMATPNKASVDTSNIKVAITNALSQNIKVVKLQNGIYDIQETIEISSDTLLIGVDHPNWSSDGNSMPTIRPALLPEKTLKDCAIMITDSGGIHGIFFDGLDKNFRATGKTMIRANASKHKDTSTAGMRISETRIREAWNGIDLTGVSSGRAYINNVFLHNVMGTGFKMGPALDFAYVSRVHVWNDLVPETFSESGLEFGRVDGISISDCAVFRAIKGFNFVEDYGNDNAPPLPNEIKRGTMGTVANCKTDGCKLSVNITSRHTLTFPGGLYMSYHRGFLIEGRGTDVTLAGTIIRTGSDQCVDAKNINSLTISGANMSRDNGNAATAVVRATNCNAVAITGSALECFAPEDSAHPAIEHRDNTYSCTWPNNIISTASRLAFFSAHNASLTARAEKNISAPTSENPKPNESKIKSKL